MEIPRIDPFTLVETGGRFALRNNPYYRAYELGELGWDIITRIRNGPTVWTVPGALINCCGGSFGNEAIAYSISSCTPFTATLCGLSGQAIGPNGDFALNRGVLYVDRYDVAPGVTRVTIRGVYARPAGSVGVKPEQKSTPIWGGVQYMPKPVPRPFNGPEVAPQPELLPKPDPDARPDIDWRPQPRRVKEQKARTQVAVARLARVAFAATETVDLIGALYDALPKDVRDKVVPTGVLSKTARLQGKYVTAFDKAKALYRNWKTLDVPEAVRNVIKNHIVDAIVGGLSRNQQEWFKKQGFTQTGGVINL